jgi:Ca-activated chloride channel family protein
VDLKRKPGTWNLALRSILAVVWVVCACSAFGQAADSVATSAPRKVHLPPDLPVKAYWPEIHLNVLVLDKDKHPAGQLTKADFQIRQDGVSQAIESVSAPDAPVSLGLIIDTSSSTQPLRQQTADAAVALVKGLPAGSEVMAVLFADEGYLDVPFVPVSAIDPDYVVRHLESRGGTALFDSLIAANDYFVSHAHEKRRAMVLISDGGENASMKTLNDAAHSILTPRSPLLYLLGMPNEGGKTAHAGEDRERLKNIARVSGGIVYPAGKPDDAPGLAKEISEAIRSQYALTYTSTDASQNGQLHKLDVTVRHGGMQVYGLPEYMAPTP